MSEPNEVANRLIFPYLNHAISMLETGYATREDIDAGMRFGCGLPTGPLALADAIGLDQVAAQLTTLHAETGADVHQPRELLTKLVAAGNTGKASGKGFYTYAAAGSDEVVSDESTPAAGAAGAEIRPVATVGVVGSGTMATGIIEVFAKSGFPVTFIARSDEKVQGVKDAVAKSLGRAVAKGRMEQSAADEIVARLTGATDRAALSEVDLVVEAIAEELEIKKQLFRDLDANCKPGAILATTTSSLPIAQLAAETKRPGDVIGMHFFNPAPIMKLVEIVRTDETAADVVATVVDLCAKTSKVAVHCTDRSGFIVNALLFPYLNDAIKAKAAGLGNVDSIDEAITSAYGYPMGPFALLDVVGLDVSLAIEEELVAEFKHADWQPAPELVELVKAGDLGRKTKKGFRSY